MIVLVYFKTTLAMVSQIKTMSIQISKIGAQEFTVEIFPVKSYMCKDVSKTLPALAARHVAIIIRHMVDCGSVDQETTVFIPQAHH